MWRKGKLSRGNGRSFGIDLAACMKESKPAQLTFQTSKAEHEFQSESQKLL
jgi:hypothetical protein